MPPTWRIAITLGATGILLSLAGCTSSSATRVARNFDKALQEVCPLGSAPDTDRTHVLRGRIALAAIAGFGYRNIDRFSPEGDRAPDALRLVNRLAAASSALDKADASTEKPLFPILRADYIDELVRSASVASQPAGSQVASLLGSSAGGFPFMPARNIVTSLMEDELYSVAFRDACTRVDAAGLDAATGAARQRVSDRCKSMAAWTAPLQPSCPAP